MNIFGAFVDKNKDKKDSVVNYFFFKKLISFNQCDKSYTWI